MKTILKQNRLLLVSLSTVALLCAYSANAADCSAEGGSCGGGGNTINGETVDSYLGHHKQDPAYLRSQVKDVLAQVNAAAPGFAKELERGFETLDWYIVDQPLKALPFSRTEIPFETQQTAVQVGNSVYFYDKALAALTKNNRSNSVALTVEQQKIIVHELVRRIQLSGEGTNILVTPISASKVTELLMPVDGRGLNKSTLAANLERLGFSPEGAVEHSAPIKKPRKLAFVDPVQVNIPLSQPVTLRDARKIVGKCYGSQEGLTPLDRSSLIGQMFWPFVKNQLEESDFYLSGTKIHYEQSSTPNLLPFADQVVAVRKLKNSTDHLRPFVGHARMYNLNNPEKLEIGFMAQTQRNPEKYVEVKAAPSQAFPQIAHHVMDNQRLFDDWGMVNEDMLLDQVAITIERDQYLNGKKLGFKNQQTGVDLPMKINTKIYADCIQNGLTQESRKVSIGAREPSSVNQSKDQKKQNIMDLYNDEEGQAQDKAL